MILCIRPYISGLRPKIPFSFLSSRFGFSSSTKSQHKSIKDVLFDMIPKERERIAAFRKEHGAAKVGEVTVNMMYGGMRGIKGLVTETSILDPDEGIRFRGLTIEDCKKVLPKAQKSEQPLPEGLLFLLMTGQIPSDQQVKAISCELFERSELPSHVTNLLMNFPSTVHPMAQLSAACAALSSESKFVKAYSSVGKSDQWIYAYEDSIDLIAKLPTIASLIYNNTFRDGRNIAQIDPKGDWSMNFAKALGYGDPLFTELLRKYLFLHSDHEGGNVSAHTCHLVGSALSDPYLSFSAAMCGLAGPLHGLANQEVLAWINELVESVGIAPTDEDVLKFLNSTTESGKVIPGFGHAVLRKTDPRYMSLREFALKYLPDDPYVKIVAQCYKLIPEYLAKMGKVANPWPNVDAHSGVLLQHFGMKEQTFYTVLFGVSRSLGVLSSLVWDRALGLPIERPKSMSTEALMKNVSAKAA